MLAHCAVPLISSRRTRNRAPAGTFARSRARAGESEHGCDGSAPPRRVPSGQPPPGGEPPQRAVTTHAWSACDGAATASARGNYRHAPSSPQRFPFSRRPHHAVGTSCRGARPQAAVVTATGDRPPNRAPAVAPPPTAVSTAASGRRAEPPLSATEHRIARVPAAAER